MKKGKKVKKSLFVWVRASDVVEGSSLRTYKTQKEALVAAKGSVDLGERVFILKGNFEKIGSYRYEPTKID